MSEEFEVTYEVEDGYAGKSRPQHTSISADDLEDDMGEDCLRSLFSESVQDAFEQHISWVSGQENDFVKWAQEQIAKRNSDD